MYCISNLLVLLASLLLTINLIGQRADSYIESGSALDLFTVLRCAMHVYLKCIALATNSTNQQNRTWLVMFLLSRYTLPLTPYREKSELHGISNPFLAWLLTSLLSSMADSSYAGTLLTEVPRRLS